MVGFRRRHRRGNDRGETLVELLVTIVVLGLTIPALMGAVLI
jgi:Tfp pilus assembly protein FimT